MTARQLPLELGHRPAVGRGDFLIAPCNRDAVAWVDAWPNWPGGDLAIWGPEGCGKSHLVQVWLGRAGARAIAARELIPELVPELAGGSLGVEDADRGVDEASLFHLINLLRERGHRLVLTGRVPPKRWDIRLPDLASRLAALPAVAVRAPDDALLGALMIKLFADRQLRVGDDVIAYMLARVERSFAAARDVVAALDSTALAQRRAITLPLAREILDRRD